MKYWLHRISHKSEASYPLLEEGYLSIGFSDFLSNEGFLEELRSKDKEGAWAFFEETNSSTMGFGSTRYNLWRFLYKFKIGDIILVPMYKSFSLYRVKGEPIISGDLYGKIEFKGNTVEGNKKELLYNDEKIDIGFLLPVEKIKENMSRNKYADASLTSRMKMRQTNGNITDLQESVDRALKNAKKNTPISLYGEVIEDMKKQLLDGIKSELNPDKFEQLVLWYLNKIGADKVEIPPKSESHINKGADGDIIADFEQIKVRILVQAKHHKGVTSGWSVEQIYRYSEQHQELGDGEYTYISWVLTSADEFCKKAAELAGEKNVRLINGWDFAEMLIETGLEGLDQAFI